MRAVCAWCGTLIEEGEPGDTRVSHGICPRCAGRFFPGSLRYAVVPRDRSFLFPEIESAFQAVGGIRIILDRRRGDRRRRRDIVREERRRPSQDRRQLPCPVVGAVPAVAGLSVSVGRLLGPRQSGLVVNYRIRRASRGPRSRPPRPSNPA
jgi:hypothetical protein